MATQLFANNAATTLNGAITNVATSLVVTSSTGFPAAVSGTSYFYATLSDATESIFEIVQVTNVSGTTWTIVRGQDGTSGLAWSTANIQMRPIAQGLRDIIATGNPMTTIGDTDYCSVAGTPGTVARLAGPTTNGTYLLNAIPVASVAVAPTWVLATGTGAPVCATSPTLVTPTLGVATVTSVNKVTITAPATSATLTLAQGSSLITSGAFALTLSIPATITATFPSVSGTVAFTNSANTWSATQTFSVMSVFTLGMQLTAQAAGSTAGQFWYDSTQLAHGFFASGVKQMNSTTLFTQTATGTNGAATAITNILGTGVGTAVLPGAFFVPGKTIKVTVRGTLTTAAAPGTTVITLRLNAGTPVTVAVSVSQTLVASMTNVSFMMEFLLTCRTSTTVYGSGYMMVAAQTGNTTMSVIQVANSAAATIVNATSYTVEVDATNGTASGTIYTTQACVIEVLN